MYKFTTVDINTLDRSMYYYYFMEVGTSLNMTVKIDVTNAVTKCKTESLSFYGYSINAITNTVNSIENLRYDLKDGELILWDKLVPTFTNINPQTKLFHALWSDNTGNYKEFDTIFKQLIHKYSNSNSITPMIDMPKNIVNISSLPWLHFENFSSQNNHSNTTLLPMITIGKYEEIDNKLLLPVSIKVHHATIDGYHLSLFFETLQMNMNR